MHREGSLDDIKHRAINEDALNVFSDEKRQLKEIQTKKSTVIKASLVSSSRNNQNAFPRLKHTEIPLRKKVLIKKYGIKA